MGVAPSSPARVRQTPLSRDRDGGQRLPTSTPPGPDPATAGGRPGRGAARTHRSLLRAPAGPSACRAQPPDSAGPPLLVLTSRPPAPRPPPAPWPPGPRRRPASQPCRRAASAHARPAPRTRPAHRRRRVGRGAPEAVPGRVAGLRLPPRTARGPAPPAASGAGVAARSARPVRLPSPEEA